MKPHRPKSKPPAARDVYARLTQQLQAFVERERKANRASWVASEDEKLTRARLALFGSAPK